MVYTVFFITTALMDFVGTLRILTEIEASNKMKEPPHPVNGKTW